jgi:hypothetical protein
VIGTVFASIGGLIGLALLAGGIAVIVAYAFGQLTGAKSLQRRIFPTEHRAQKPGPTGRNRPSFAASVAVSPNEPIARRSHRCPPSLT